MHRKKITSIRTETLEQWAIRSRVPDGGPELCALCKAATNWLSMASACVIGGGPPAAICKGVDEGILHSSITPEGHLLICETSLRNKALRGEENES